MDLLSHERRVEALNRLESSDHYQARQRLKAIDVLLVVTEDFCGSDLQRILTKRTYPLQIERAITLYLMMARVMKLCEPKGFNVGPTCIVQRINFQELTREQAFDLKNGIGFRLAFREWNSAKRRFSGLDLLSNEEIDLYEKIKPYFNGRAKPTLKTLAARLLRDSTDRSFSDRSIVRYVKALRDYKFADQNARRDYLISSVNSFGVHNMSARESARYAFAELALQMRPVITESVRQFYETLPLVAQSVTLAANSFSQIPNLLPAISRATAEFYQVIHPTIALLGQMNQIPKVRQK